MVDIKTKPAVGMKAVVETLPKTVTSNVTDSFSEQFTKLIGRLKQLVAMGEKTPETSLPGFKINKQFVVVKPITKQDENNLMAFYNKGLSKKSLETRFLTPTSTVPAGAISYLTNKNGYDRVGLGAWKINKKGNLGKLVAVAEYTVPPGDSEQNPEVAIAVADTWQGKGLATKLLTMLAVLSIAGGHEVWDATIQSGNTAVLNLLEKVGTIGNYKESLGEITLTVTLNQNFVS